MECGVHYKPLFAMSYYRELGYSARHYPNTEYAGKRVVSLPMFAGLSLADVDYVCDRVQEIVARYAR